MPTLKGTEALLSYVQYFLYLVSSSVNVSVFHIWLDTFRTDLLYFDWTKGRLHINDAFICREQLKIQGHLLFNQNPGKFCLRSRSALHELFKKDPISLYSPTLPLQHDSFFSS